MPGVADVPAGDPLVFAQFPFVEGFVLNEKAHPVAQVVQFRHMGIVRHPNRVGPGLLLKSAAATPRL